MAAAPITCSSCGTSNPSDRSRCVGCGAKVASLVEGIRAGADRAAFAPKWVAVGVAGYGIVLAIALVVLPMVLTNYDPQGLAGVLIAMAVWLVGGFGIGAAARDGRLLEPSTAAALTAAAFVPYIAAHSDVRALEFGTYLVSGCLGVLAAFMGAFFGDRLTSR